MPRITVAIKDHIVEQETKAKKFQELIGKAEKAFKMEVEKEVKRHQPKFSEKVKPFLRMTNQIKVVGLTTTRTYNNVPTNSTVTWQASEIAKTDKLVKLYKEWQDIIVEKRDFRDDLYLVLNSYTTDSKLLKVMPELSKYFTGVTTTALVPVQTIEKVRKSLVERR